MKVLETPEQIVKMVKRFSEPGAITAICGGRGRGKTNNLAFIGCWASSIGIDVITNIQYMPHPTRGEKPRNVTMITQMSELLLAGAKALREERPVLFLGDEVSIFANPRDAMTGKGKAMQEFAIVMRHLNMAAIVTTLQWHIIESTMRNSLDAYIDMDSNRKGKAERYASVTLFEPSGWNDPVTKFSYVVPASPHPYRGQNLKTYLVPDIDFRKCHEYVASSGLDVPEAIIEYVEREHRNRLYADDPEHRYDKEKTPVAYWLYMRNDGGITFEQSARLCGCTPEALKSLAHRLKLKREMVSPPSALIENKPKSNVEKNEGEHDEAEPD